MRKAIVWHKALFLAWFAWAAIGCFISNYPSLAIYGFHYRYEGLLTWTLGLFFAYYYDREFKSIRPILLPSIVLCSLYPWLDMKMPNSSGWLMVPTVAMSALAAVGFGIIFSFSWFFSVFFAFCGLYCGQRSFLTCMLLVIIFVKYRNFSLGWLRNRLILSLVVMSPLLLWLPIFNPMLTKLNHLRFDFTGSRAQWIMQAATLGRSMPLFGYGLDTGSEYIKTPVGKTAQGDEWGRAMTPDRCHNIIYDVMLWSGWVGLFLFTASIACAFFTVKENPNENNVSCALGMACYIVFGLMNPQGVPALFLFLTCLWSIKK